MTVQDGHEGVIVDSGSGTTRTQKVVAISRLEPDTTLEKMQPSFVNGSR